MDELKYTQRDIDEKDEEIEKLNKRIEELEDDLKDAEDKRDSNQDDKNAMFDKYEEVSQALNEVLKDGLSSFKSYVK